MIGNVDRSTIAGPLVHRRTTTCLVLLMMAGPWALAQSSALADAVTPLASYEPEETDLTVTPGSGDTGLTITIVQGGLNGAPAATDGDYVLKADFAGETDGKIEFKHTWSSSTYDLAGHDLLLADVYVETASAVPSLMGIWDSDWSPPDAWQLAADIPTTTGQWVTISFDVANRSQVDLDQVWAFVFEDMAGPDGTAYVDNLRFHNAALPDVGDLAATAFADRIELIWEGVTDPNLDGYNVYRAESAGGPFTKITPTPHDQDSYTDPSGAGSPRYWYYVAAVIDGEESEPSNTVSALYNGYTDEELMDIVQQVTFWYFWNYGHPNCGMAREGWGFGHSSEIVTTGGTGMGLMTIVVAVERGFVDRADAADRVLTILSFLEDNATRYHGAWSHHINGTTGATIPFSTMDDGGDLVETAFLVQGMLTARQYFDDPVDPVESEIRTRATRLWEEVEWTWYRRYTWSDVLYWHWSPIYDWGMNMPIRGYNEAMIVYILAVASPTYPMPASCYNNGWIGSGYLNGNNYYGYDQCAGPTMGGPLFFTHYSFLGLDPRHKRDAYCDYFENSRNISLIHQAYSMDNPNDFAGYSEWVWGLTASFDPFGYDAHSPTNDNGTITPTAAISAMPYTPAESLVTLRHFYDTYGVQLWGPYGFYDAFNPEESWYASGYVAIDEGTIVPMIENYRSQLCWRLFMANPEIKPALLSMGWQFDGDFDDNGEVDLADYEYFADCLTGPADGSLPPGCSTDEFEVADLDDDGDVDLDDFAQFSTLFGLP